MLEPSTYLRFNPGYAPVTFLSHTLNQSIIKTLRMLDFIQNYELIQNRLLIKCTFILPKEITLTAFDHDVFNIILKTFEEIYDYKFTSNILELWIGNTFYLEINHENSKNYGEKVTYAFQHATSSIFNCLKHHFEDYFQRAYIYDYVAIIPTIQKGFIYSNLVSDAIGFCEYVDSIE